MRVLLLFNPIAGAGRGPRVARTLEEALREEGHEPVLTESRLEAPERWLEPALAGCDALVVAGGDGAVRMAVGPAARTGTPLYHFPVGTENLFAREFGMDRSPARLLEALRRGEVRRIDLGAANGRVFALMASVGYDAEVVHDLASRRGASISHLTYAGPLVRGLLRWSAPRLAIELDGETIVDRERGFVVVANSRQYAARFDPALRASMTDGRLDVVFFPAATRRAVVAWAVRCRSRRHVRHPDLVYRTGASVVVRCDPPGPFQLDGDPPGPPGDPASTPGGEDLGGAVTELRISLSPKALPVLIP